MNDPLTTMQAVQNRPQPDLIDELPVAYVEVDAQCMVTRANRAARDLLSAQGGELVGKLAPPLAVRYRPSSNLIRPFMRHS